MQRVRGQRRPWASRCRRQSRARAPSSGSRGAAAISGGKLLAMLVAVCLPTFSVLVFSAMVVICVGMRRGLLSCEYYERVLRLSAVK